MSRVHQLSHVTTVNVPRPAMSPNQITVWMMAVLS